MKHVKKKNKVDFEGFYAHDQELMGGYYNYDRIFYVC